MYNSQLIPPDTLEWLVGNAENELNAYLCEVDFREVNGDDWPEMAREQARQCRIVAAAATPTGNGKAWLDLARQYEDSVTPAD